MVMEQRIVPVSSGMTYLDGFNKVRDKGGLPSNALHDQTLVYSDLWQKLRNTFGLYYGAWAREIIAYPAKFGSFEKGDIKDSYYNWILPQRYVPKGVFAKKGIALVIDPKDLDVVGDQVRVIPRSVTVLKFPQADGWYDFDRKTRIPIDAQPKSDAYEAKRYLWRRDEQTLRPVVRWVDGFGGRRDVGCDYRPDDDYDGLGVGYAEPQAKLKLSNDAEKQLDETFRTKVSRNNTVRLPFKVKQGREVEVTLRTL